MISGFTHIPGQIAYMDSTSESFWRKFARENLEYVVENVISFCSPLKPRCIFCGKHSFTYSSIRTLTRHLKGSHVAYNQNNVKNEGNQVIEFYIEKLTKIKPSRMDEIRKTVLVEVSA